MAARAGVQPRHVTRRSALRRSSARRAGAVAVRASDAGGAVAGTPVPPTSMLVIGATGTLGRQVVRRALDEGYEVRCLVRPRPVPADFLREWGATTVSGDLSNPEELPAALVGIHTIVDCATGRPEEPIQKIDWEAKVKLIQSAKAMGVQRFVFFSIDKCDQYQKVPLMRIKYCTEKYLEASGLNFTTLRLCGFMQPLISAYAVPILEEQSVWGTNDQTRIAYMDAQDVAKMTMAAIKNDATIGRTLTLAGPKAHTTQEVIKMCEDLAGVSAKVSTVPSILLSIARAFTSFFQWSRDAADRLAFVQVVSQNATLDADMKETYELLGMSEEDVTSLDDYMREYFGKIIKKLKEVSAESKQREYYL